MFKNFSFSDHLVKYNMFKNLNCVAFMSFGLLALAFGSQFFESLSDGMPSLVYPDMCFQLSDVTRVDWYTVHEQVLGVGVVYSSNEFPILHNLGKKKFNESSCLLKYMNFVEVNVSVALPPQMIFGVCCHFIGVQKQHKPKIGHYQAVLRKNKLLFDNIFITQLILLLANNLHVIKRNGSAALNLSQWSQPLRETPAAADIFPNAESHGLLRVRTKHESEDSVAVWLAASGADFEFDDFRRSDAALLIKSLVSEAYEPRDSLTLLSYNNLSKFDVITPSTLMSMTLGQKMCPTQVVITTFIEATVLGHETGSNQEVRLAFIMVDTLFVLDSALRCRKVVVRHGTAAVWLSVGVKYAAGGAFPDLANIAYDRPVRVWWTKVAVSDTTAVEFFAEKLTRQMVVAAHEVPATSTAVLTERWWSKYQCDEAFHGSEGRGRTELGTNGFTLACQPTCEGLADYSCRLTRELRGGVLTAVRLPAFKRGIRLPVSPYSNDCLAQDCVWSPISWGLVLAGLLALTCLDCLVIPDRKHVCKLHVLVRVSRQLSLRVRYYAYETFTAFKRRVATRCNIYLADFSRYRAGRPLMMKLLSDGVMPSRRGMNRRPTGVETFLSVRISRLLFCRLQYCPHESLTEFKERVARQFGIDSAEFRLERTGRALSLDHLGDGSEEGIVVDLCFRLLGGNPMDPQGEGSYHAAVGMPRNDDGVRPIISKGGDLTWAGISAACHEREGPLTSPGADMLV